MFMRLEAALRYVFVALCLVACVVPTAAQEGGPLAGRIVVISPGHGLTYFSDCDCYKFQRRHQGEVLEDLVNAEIAMQLVAMLRGAGATVYATRSLDPNPGASGKPAWHENARQHLIALGLSETIWNTGTTTLTSDLYSRPLYANHVNADIFVSIHNDIGGGTGTSFIYDTHDYHRAGGRALAQRIEAAFMARVRADYDPDWQSREVRGYDALGEIRLAQMPAVLIEVAFMDNPQKDYLALLDPAFKHAAAQGIYEGILNYFTGAPASAQSEDVPMPTAVPLAPGTLRAPTAVVVRSGPGVENAEVDVLPAGQVAQILDQADALEGTWLKIGEGRWVAGWVVETAPVAAVEAAASPPAATEAAPLAAAAPPTLAPGTLRATTAAVVRSGPGASYAQVGVLGEGQIASVLGQEATFEGTWFQIGADRWVNAWVVEVASAAGPGADAENMPTEATLAPGMLRADVAVVVRGGPGEDYPQVGVLRQGETAAIEGRDIYGLWLMVGEGRWVGRQVVTVAGDVETLPVVSP